MRLSRRNRYGVIPPTNATYAHAISACQKARYPDLKGVELLLRWAEDDGIKPNVFMYSGAIWTAQRSGNCAKALEFFSEMQSAECRVNSVAFNGVISALCDHGDIQKAVAMYDHMKDQGFHLFASTCRVSIVYLFKALLVNFDPLSTWNNHNGFSESGCCSPVYEKHGQ